MWWLHRRLDVSELPGTRYTIYIRFSDHPKRYWIVVDGDASICLADPGFELDVSVETDRSTLYRTYLGHQSLNDALRAGTLDLAGSRTAIRCFAKAFQPSPVADIVAAETRAAGLDLTAGGP